MNFPPPYPFTLGLILLTTPLLHADIVYSVTEIGLLPGSRGSIATAINNDGQIVGYSEYSASSGDHAFLYSNGQMQDLGFLPGGDSSAAFAINNLGQITGAANPSAGAQVPFLYSNGQMQQLGPSFGASGAGSAINDLGQVTGVIAQTGNQAFLYGNGVFQYLKPISGDYIAVSGINNAGQVTGWRQLRGGPAQSFIYGNGNVMYLGTLPGYVSAEAEGINNLGQVVGTMSTLSAGPSHVFEYTDAQMIDLGEGLASAINNLGQIVGYDGYAALYSNGVIQHLDKLIDPSLGITLGNAVAINDKGQIVTSDLNSNKSYLLSPVPEPASWTLLACSLLLFVVFRIESRDRTSPYLKGEPKNTISVRSQPPRVPVTAEHLPRKLDGSEAC